MENKKDIPSGKATIIAALIAGVFGLLVVFLKPDPPATPTSGVLPPTIHQEQNLNLNTNTESLLCTKIKARADLVSSYLDKKQKKLDDLVPLKLELLICRDKLSNFSNFSCDKITEEYNSIVNDIEKAEKLLSNE